MLVTFDSISSSLRLQTASAAAEAAGTERGFSCTLIPIPRNISSSCGYAAEVEMEESEDLLKLLHELNLEWDAVYRPSGKEYEAIYAHGED